MDFVSLAEAKARPGTRIVVAANVPSPWSEAAKNLFHIAQLPFVAVRVKDDPAGVSAWAGTDNAPVVVHDDEPMRSSWAAIIGLAARLAPGRVLPLDPARRAGVMGAVELLAGESGLGWNVRLTMIHDGLVTDGASGFPARAAGYLAKRYGYVAAEAEQLPEKVAAQLAVLERILDGNDYYGGASPDALDVYVASFLTILTPLAEPDCPGISPPLRAAFLGAAQKLGPLVSVKMRAQRARMFQHHLAWPIQL